MVTVEPVVVVGKSMAPAVLVVTPTKSRLFVRKSPGRVRNAKNLRKNRSKEGNHTLKIAF